jgi:CRP/FNR family transcriptional regulator
LKIGAAEEMNPPSICSGIGCAIMEFARASEGVSMVRLLEQWRMTQVYRRGDKLFEQHRTGNGIHCIQSGNVLLWQMDAFGMKTSFRVAGRGEMLGYRSTLGDDRHAATAEALTECRVCFYPKKQLEELIYDDPMVARHFFRLVARDRGPPDALMLRGQHLPVRVRLVYLLLTTKDRHADTRPDGSLVFDLPLSRKDIASLIASRPETVTRAIKSLANDGIAEFYNRKVIVPDPERLYEEVSIEREEE